MKPGKYHFNQGISINITSKKTKKHNVPYCIMRWAGHSFAYKIFLPKMHNLSPIMTIHQKNSNRGTLYKITAYFKNDKEFLIDCSRSKDTKEAWQLYVIYDLAFDPGPGKEKVNA